MTPTEVISEIQKLPLNDVRRITDQLTTYLREQEQAKPTNEEVEERENEFERYLLAKDVASHVATRNETDEEFDAFEMLQVEGEPLSETIIRERR